MTRVGVNVPYITREAHITEKHKSSFQIRCNHLPPIASELHLIVLLDHCELPAAISASLMRK
ncbi:hypothetical protein M404DRAFT_993359 [Pisolithus tinctorius Marx 270]|uniref:Uncharacterized protein n=1 Tax=Pisolithus tinctorius Marx 270 TaxID=870435 RepID=A0A0C3JTB7_PISTI|nr:hypothetical protein M404DRAFT_993359 [Pisolithus tinctorius Marx 270]